MRKAITRLGLAIATSLIFAGGPAVAAPATGELADLQQQLNALRSEYDAKISALEARLKAAEAKAGAPLDVTAPAVDAAPGEVLIEEPTTTADANAPPRPAAATASGNAMNPGISVVLNGNYVAMSRDPALARIPGFPLSGEAGLFPRGFSLGESEVTLAANVDPYFLANLTASIGRENDISVEEAYVQTTALPAGLTAKAGRFFSSVGYLNERHAHNWSFIDMPLPYRAFLGTQYGDDGVQLRWLAPTPIFLEVGAEAFRGDSFPAANGERNTPGTWTAFAHFGADINDSSSWLGSLSVLHGEARARDIGGDIFDGKDDLGIASLVYKWAPGGNLAERSLILSGEYFLGQQDGAFNGDTLRRGEQGWYVQGVYQFARRWSAGLRYARLDADGVAGPLVGSALDRLGRSPQAISGLLEFDTSEFARFRAQFTHDMSDTRANDLLMLQYTVVYGPHSAHRY